MRIENIGELTDQATYWRLVYDHCRHVQLFARLGLEDFQRAMREVQRYYAQCLDCRLEIAKRRET